MSDRVIDWLHELSDQHLAELYHDFVHQLVDQPEHNTPVLALISMARVHARYAIVGLVEVDPFDSQKIIKLQNEVRRYDDLMDFARNAIDEGFQAEVIHRDSIKKHMAAPKHEEQTDLEDS